MPVQVSGSRLMNLYSSCVVGSSLIRAQRRIRSGVYATEHVPALCIRKRSPSRWLTMDMHIFRICFISDRVSNKTLKTEGVRLDNPSGTNESRMNPHILNERPSISSASVKGLVSFCLESVIPRKYDEFVGATVTQ